MSIKLWTTDINKIYLWTTEIKKIYLGSTIIYDKWIPTDWLIAEYLLDWNVLDTSWNWNNWTATNVTYTTWLKDKQCAVFNGSSSKIATSSFNIWTNDFTWCWRLNTWSSWNQIILSNSNWWNYTQLVLFNWWYEFPIFASDFQWWSFSTWTWIHFLIERNWNNKSLYINNIIINTQDCSWQSAWNDNMNLWQRPFDNIFPFLWNQQNIRYYNRALDSQEKTQLYNELL